MSKSRITKVLMAAATLPGRLLSRGIAHLLWYPRWARWHPWTAAIDALLGLAISWAAWRLVMQPASWHVPLAALLSAGLADAVLWLLSWRARHVARHAAGGLR